jgi:phosphate transport system substrate-binding protein
MNKQLWTLGLVGIALALTGCGGGTGKTNLRGAGSSFVKPVMDSWIAAYTKAKGGKINYQATGSGNGIKSMIDRAVDFGGTDAFLSDPDLDRAKNAERGGEVIHIPLVMGGIVPAYNLEGIEKPLNFTGEVLAEIYLKKITRWNDDKIAAINEGVKLPDKEIAVAGRSDSSGSTSIFTEYLSKVHPEFKKKVGTGTKVKWEVTGENGTSGVAGFVKKTANSLGYIELTYALQNNIAYGKVQNQAGEFVQATLDSVSKAAENSLKEIPDDLRFSITNPPGKGAYPISGTTWAVVYTRQPADVARQLVDFFTWVSGPEGQDAARELDYAPLPKGLVKKIKAKLDLIQAEK